MTETASSDRELSQFLAECDASAAYAVVCTLSSKFSPSSKTLASQYPTVESIEVLGNAERARLADDLVFLLRWYGSDAFAYASRKLARREPGAHYHGIVRDIARLLNRQLPKKERMKLPRVASVAEWEEIVVRLVLATSFRGKNDEEIADMFEEAGLEHDAAIDAVRKYTPGGLLGMGLPVLAKLLGKKTIQTLVNQLIVALTYRFLGKEAAKTLAGRLLVKFSQKMITRFISIIGWALLVLDTALFLSRPAKRITVRAVPLISCFRCRDRLSQGE